jgi:hypothetical protein
LRFGWVIALVADGRSGLLAKARAIGSMPLARRESAIHIQSLLENCVHAVRILAVHSSQSRGIRRRGTPFPLLTQAASCPFTAHAALHEYPAMPRLASHIFLLAASLLLLAQTHAQSIPGTFLPLDSRWLDQNNTPGTLYLGGADLFVDHRELVARGQHQGARAR